MAIFEVLSTVTHRSLMNKSKDDLARWIMHLLNCRDESEQARVRRITDLLEANNAYQQMARDARAELAKKNTVIKHLEASDAKWGLLHQKVIEQRAALIRENERLQQQIGGGNQP